MLFIGHQSTAFGKRGVPGTRAQLHVLVPRMRGTGIARDPSTAGRSVREPTWKSKNATHIRVPVRYTSSP